MDFSKCRCIDNNGYPIDDSEVRRFISAVPSPRQLKFNEMKYYNFIHFGMTTFTGKEWGEGDEPESQFNPTALDTDQWCRVLKESGSRGIILTAKHHDGFCIFHSKYTTHSVEYSPYGKDIVKELSQSCKKYGLKLGLYLSPWDRHEKTYGTAEYNDFFVNQLTELCTNYGELFCLWFDGACGEGPNGKKQVYDWSRYYALIRELQPNAVIAISGPDVRWIGNEGGQVRKAEWSVVPWTLKTVDEVAESSQQNADDAEAMASFNPLDEDLGSREKLKNLVDLHWSPAEADVSVTYGWFWHDDDYYKNNERGSSRTPEELAQIFFNTVGGNASMLLNVPVDTRGLISDREIKTLRGFTEILRETFKEETERELFIITSGGEVRKPGSGDFMLQNDEAAIKIVPTKNIKALTIEEDIRFSQRIEAFDIYVNGELYDSGTVVGSGKIIRFPESLSAKEIVILIRQSRSNPVIKAVKTFA